MDNKKHTQLELQEIFQLDALELIHFYNRGKIIHKSKDISASGDEVEISFREILKRKLPNRYYVGHGHIVDKSLNSTPQFDVIIADNTNAPILFRTQKGSEYFPFESVYAIGEVKSTYYKDNKPIEAFVKNIVKTKSNLQRKQTLPNDTGIGFSFDSPLTNNPYRNPLFTFMIFVNSNNFTFDDIREFYSSTEDANLPNIICFLDKGAIVNAQIQVTDEGNQNTGLINIIPEFNQNISNRNNHFVFYEMGDSSYRQGSNLAYLYFVLFTHLVDCKLENPELVKYLQSMLWVDGGTIVDRISVKTVRDLLNRSTDENIIDLQNFLNNIDEKIKEDFLNMQIDLENESNPEKLKESMAAFLKNKLGIDEFVNFDSNDLNNKSYD